MVFEKYSSVPVLMLRFVFYWVRNTTLHKLYTVLSHTAACSIENFIIMPSYAQVFSGLYSVKVELWKKNMVVWLFSCAFLKWSRGVSTGTILVHSNLLRNYAQNVVPWAPSPYIIHYRQQLNLTIALEFDISWATKAFGCFKSQVL
jgi:hypothetical protein